MRGQQEAMTAILISGILIGIVGSVYFWGLPLIQKNKDVSILEDSEGFMKSLDNKIKYVANHGGRDQIKINVPGTLKFDGEKLSLQIETIGTIYSAESLIPLERNSCTRVGGNWGIHDPSILCLLSSCIDPGCTKYITAYELSYIPLNVYDPSDTVVLNTYKIKLNGEPAEGGIDHLVIVENKGIEEDVDGILINTIISINIV